MCDGEDPSQLGPEWECIGCEKSPGVGRKVRFRRARGGAIAAAYQKQEKTPTFDHRAIMG